MWSVNSLCYKCVHCKVCSKWPDIVPVEKMDPSVEIVLVNCDDFLEVK